MAAFGNPFSGNVERKMTDEELIQAIRLNIAGELEAIYIYDAHIQATANEIAKRVISDIRDEEKAHIGELMTLLHVLDPKEAEAFAEGEAEVREMLKDLGIPAPAAQQPAKASEASNVKTVGSLLNQ